MSNNPVFPVRNQRISSDLPRPLLISASDFARMLQVSDRTLWRLQSAGKLPPVIRIGGSTRWRLLEVEEWIAGGCPKPNSTQE